MTNYRDTLEQLIDQHGEGLILSAFTQICFEKAEHLRANWQDEVSAKYWERLAKQVDKLDPHCYR